MSTWEYLTLDVIDHGASRVEDITRGPAMKTPLPRGHNMYSAVGDVLNRVGAEGWELVGLIRLPPNVPMGGGSLLERYVFKRPKAADEAS